MYTKVPALLGFFIGSLICNSTQAAEGKDAVIRGVNYEGLSVSDIDRSTDFYGIGANLQLVQQSGISNNSAFDELAGRNGVRVESRLLKSKNSQLRLMQFQSPSEFARAYYPVEAPGPGIAHVCFRVAITTDTYQRFLDLGATPNGEREMVQLNARNPVVYAYVHDLDEIISEVERVNFEKTNTQRTNDYRIRHVSLVTPNMERLVKFYSAARS